jgi:hypothetical protein
MEDTLKGAAFEFDKDDTMTGFEQMDVSTKSVPFLRIAQDLTPQRKKERAEYIDGLDVGMYFNTITRKIVAKPFRCIVLAFEHMYIEWKPNREGFVERHSIANATRLALDPTKFGKWYRKDTGDGKDVNTMNVLQETYTYALIIEGHEAEGPIILSLASGSMKTAKAWNRLMTTHILDDGSLAKPYYLVWSMDTEYVPAKQGKSDYYVPKPVFDSVIGDKAMYLAVKQERLALPDKHVDYAQLEGEAAIESEDF